MAGKRPSCMDRSRLLADGSVVVKQWLPSRPEALEVAATLEVIDEGGDTVLQLAEPRFRQGARALERYLEESD